MKVRYRARKAEREIRELSSEYNQDMAVEAQKYLGKNFNSADGWRLSGAREAMKNVIDILAQNNLLYL